MNAVGYVALQDRLRSGLERLGLGSRGCFQHRNREIILSNTSGPSEPPPRRFPQTWPNPAKTGKREELQGFQDACGRSGTEGMTSMKNPLWFPSRGSFPKTRGRSQKPAPARNSKLWDWTSVMKHVKSIRFTATKPKRVLRFPDLNTKSGIQPWLLRCCERSLLPSIHRTFGKLQGRRVGSDRFDSSAVPGSHGACRARPPERGSAHVHSHRSSPEPWRCVDR